MLTKLVWGLFGHNFCLSPVKGVVFAFDAINTQKKTITMIVDSGNYYLE